MSLLDQISALPLPTLNHWGYWLILAAVIFSLAVVYFYRFINKQKHIFSRYHLKTLLVSILSLSLFAKMTEDVIDSEKVTQIDLWINQNLPLIRTPILTKIMTIATYLANPWELTLFSLILLALLIYGKKWYYSLLLTLSLSGGLLFETLIKLFIHRPRPTNALVDIGGYSFPSGHATMALIFFSLLIYSCKNDFHNQILKNLFIAANIILFLLIGLSRIYLNVHWFSDVVAGFSLGLFWLTFLILIFKVTSSFTQKHQAKKLFQQP